MLTEFATPCKVLVAIAHEEWREFVIKGMSQHSEVYDIYKDPDSLLPQLFKIPCFFIVLDYPTYKRVEADLTAYHYPTVIEEITPILVYGVGAEGLIQHPCLINGDSTHPVMVSSFFFDCRRKARYL